MSFKKVAFYFLFVIVSCKSVPSKTKENKENPTALHSANGENKYATIKEIALPNGFKRMIAAENSFAEFLENISLKNDKTVYLFDGSEKLNQQAQFAVLNISVGNKNLQQCADAVMRLRAEYLFANERFEEISFADNNKKAYIFTAPYTNDHFKSYLDLVFGMCGSASLAKQLVPVSTFSNIKAGDVIIRGGFPGHAVIVMDIATNKAGQKIYLLAQSYMPAQDIHVLINPNDNNLSPWYLADENTTVKTPEYLFTSRELKTWE